jgi:hypothetical protein
MNASSDSTHSLMVMRSLDTPERNLSRQKMREERLSRPLEFTNPALNKTASGVDLYKNRTILKNVSL